jgi:hypothetical protein
VGLLKQAKAMSSAAKVVLDRLTKKQFASPVEVQAALVEEMTKAGRD